MGRVEAENSSILIFVHGAGRVQTDKRKNLRGVLKKVVIILSYKIVILRGHSGTSMKVLFIRH